VDVSSFFDLLSVVCKADDTQIKSGTFLDIGSGTGKAVLTAATFGFENSVGIEIVKELHDLARTFCHDTQKAYPGVINARFILGSCFGEEELWSSAQVIFLPITLFTDDNVQQIESLVSSRVKPETILLSTTRRLSSRNLAYLSNYRLKLFKGSLSVHCYKCISATTTDSSG